MREPNDTCQNMWIHNWLAIVQQDQYVHGGNKSLTEKTLQEELGHANGLQHTDILNKNAPKQWSYVAY